MRRYAMTMTMAAVSVAILLLGLPLGGAWIASALRTAGGENRVTIIGTVILVIVLIGAGAFFILRKRKPEEEQQVIEDAPIDITPNDKN